MKLKLFFLTVLSAFLFIGCSTDNQEEFFDDSSNFERSNNNVTAKVNERPFKVRGSGTWYVDMGGTACYPNEQNQFPSGLTQVIIEGNGNATHLGLFDVSITACTNFFDYYFFDATLTAANGDELSAISVDWGYTEDGEEWTDYIFDGGTGRFQEATGELRMIGVSVPTEFFEDPPNPPVPVAGVYSNYGYGFIVY